jgi:hypothetical protein
MRTKLIALAAFSILFLASCKKDKNEESKTDILTKSSWKLDTYGLDTDGDLKLTGNEIQMRDCDQDDIITFTKNGATTFNVGADNCQGSVSSSESTWQFFDNEATIDYKGYKMVIETLTNSKFEIRSYGPSTTYIVILKK